MSGYRGNDYSQQGGEFGRDRRYSAGRHDANYGGGGIRREDNYQSESRLNQAQGEASSYYNSNDNIQSSGRNDDGRDESSDQNEPQRQNLETPTSRHGAERQNSYQSENQSDDGNEFSSAAKHANQHAGSSADPDLFSSVLSALGQNRHSIANQNVDEEDAIQSHQQYFGGNGNQPTQASSGSMGSAAAMQALKLFLGKGNSSQQGNTQQGQNQPQNVEGNPQNQFIGMALAEASKLFDHQSSQGNVASGTSKQSVVQQAGEMALKMYLKGQGGSGASGLLGKFL